MVEKVTIIVKSIMHILKNSACFLFFWGTFFSMAHLISGCSMSYDGEKLFFREGCSQCHTFKAKGGRMGPDLSAITNIKSDKWIDSYIQKPKEINPFARMPSFKNLSGAKRKAIIAFLKK
jgi:cbb3-type cytochrome oxidase cytochrome c subunit